MALCFDRVVTSLLCTEDARESEWEDNTGCSNCDLLGCKQRGKEIFDMPSMEDDDFITLLMQKEDILMNKSRDYIDSYEGKDAELQMRAHMVNWMLDVHAHYGFSAQTAFLSVSYFDRFLSKHANSRGKTWFLQLVAISSISLAVKLQETEVPLLSDLQVGDIQYAFESCTIQRMELLIMSTLNWEMISVTPFSYLLYLLQKTYFLNGLSQALISRSDELILRSCRDFRFVAYSPSVAAVASLVSACKEEVPSQAACLQRALLSVWPMKEREVMEWTRLMEEMLQGDPFWSPPAHKVALWKSSAPQSPMGVLDAACFSSESCDRTLNTSSTTVCGSMSPGMRSSMMTNNALHPISLTGTKVSSAFNDVVAASLTSSLPPQLP
ncbi:hypothetical protein GOP47_0006048 [Adiantum capillus-veneris]|uniref:Cyclin-like domain-containing protein n=1 Tax=Adiantum capillus-veneris TaxID=13818 RepID=A0A9D4V305_ADICA|nr:hypothetical protein GOP47_0006048 [Adiantum capillus-veneris]